MVRGEEGEGQGDRNKQRDERIRLRDQESCGLLAKVMDHILGQRERERWYAALYEASEGGEERETNQCEEVLQGQ
jgi:hypothetical protein